MKLFLRSVCFALMLGPAVYHGPAVGEQLIKVKIARLAFPSMSSMMIDVVKERGIDKKHGIDLETMSNSAVSVFYASIASGEAEVIPGGPHVFQKMMLEGVLIDIAVS